MAEAVSFIAHGPRDPDGQGRSREPGAFADLLYLASLAWEAPRVLLAVAGEDGGWSLHTAGEHHTPVLDRAWLDLVCAADGPVEIGNLALERPDSPLAVFPHSMRWVYALAIRAGSGRVLAVLAVMDRWIRTVSGRDQRVLQMVARQVRARLDPVVPAPVSRPPAPLSRPVPSSPPAPPSASLQAETVLRLRPVRPSRQDVRTRLLRSSEVAALFDVTERTVINWAAAGKLPSIRTVGGHLRFRQDDIMEMISGPASC